MRSPMTLGCHAAILFIGMIFTISSTQAFVLEKRTRTADETRLDKVHRACAQRTISGFVSDLRGGKSVASTKGSSSKSNGVSKSGSRSKASAKSTKTKNKAKHKGKAKAKAKDGRPTLRATVNAFFQSLINPRFVLKLEAKQQDRIHTVHGSASMQSSTKSST